MAVASRPRRLPRVGGFPDSFGGVLVPAAIVVALFAISIFLRTRALGESLWMDEGLSIGIASQPLFDIPGILRQDGSPPLYYMALSVWMDIFGAGPAETQGLSLVISLLTVPAGLWAGWSLFGRRAGLIAAALFAMNVFVTAYAQETRMYSLMVLLSLLVTASFLHVYVYRHRRYLPVFGAALALMLYTHNWGLFVGLGAVLALIPLWARSEDRRALVRDAGIGFGVAGLLYLPWLPTLLYQVQHTGAPWLNPPRLGAPVQISKSLLGGGTPTVALVLAGGAGLAAVLSRRLGDRERSAIIAAAAFCVATLAVAWLFSQFSPAWTTRYLGVALAPILLLAALGLSRSGNLGLVALVIVLGVWAVPKTYGLKNKSNASDMGTQVSEDRLLRPGDLVISMQPEQAPLIDYSIPVGGLRFATPMGPVENPKVMDWRDSQERLEDATTATTLEPLLAKLPRSGRVLIVHPVTSNLDDWDAPWTQLVRRRSAQWGAAVARDRRFKRVAVVPPFYRRATRIGIRGVLYEKTGT